ncbi:helix-turn-helix domain-containing protein [Rhodococcus sp. IEGM 1381]|uniref:sigma-54-dependent Fis family transcriptional regulator n=1 Tax=Rhodococcus sp. IEGM 1381 TaxID=3047085 RepID=UPI0024B76AF3|nr:helix-turn-helix domain-containing protein [Rhodococcus sp. IEGM 1381]MDI9896446.1 helix-turn-helix domain-containing protein [Rhodococcus sp. IEGM 1381]
MSDAVREAKRHLMRAGLLSGAPDEGVVPDLILRSWRRSIGSSADATMPSQKFDEIDTDSILRRAADPVLDRWQDQLVDTGTTLFLSDRAGSIVARRASDRGLQRKLDRVNAAEGFDYSEDSIGTNGLGTSMVEGRAVYIEGSQHFNESLSVLACAAVPVYTPSGLVIGSVSLGGPLAIASSLMVTLTKEIGQQIEERLKAAARPQDLALAMSFMRYANSRRPTVIMDRETLLANTPGLPYVSVDSHVVLWDRLSAHNWALVNTARWDIDAGAVAVTARRVVEGARDYYVLHFAPVPRDEVSTAGPIGPRTHVDTASREAVEAAVTVIDGPRGSGRASRALDVRAGRGEGRELEVVILSTDTATPWSAVADLLDGGRDVLIRRLESVQDHEAGPVVTLVQDHREAVAAGRRNQLLITTCVDASSPEFAALVKHWGIDARTEALSDSPDRIPGLVRSILDQVDTTRRHSMSPTAFQSLMQWDWPGNIAELTATVTTLASSVTASVIERHHLPEHLQRAPARRKMTMMESAERDAIVEALDRAGGNKSVAAELLGIGRTTLYRRLRQLGLGDGEASL